jgi:flagellar biosynthesis chaperone FliJ
MMDADRKFIYRLEALIRLRGAERDAAGAEATQAKREVERRARECDEIGQAIALLEALLREQRAGGRAISVDEQVRTQDYLRLRRAVLEGKQRELADASRTMLRLLGEFQKKRQEARTLEKHRERQRSRFTQTHARAALTTADDQWLRRKQGS